MQDIFDYVRENGINDLQITINEVKDNTIDTINDNIKSIDLLEYTYYVIKAIYNGKRISFKTNKLDKKEIVDKIKKYVNYIQNNEEDYIIKEGNIKCKRNIYDMDIFKYKDYLLELNKKYKKDIFKSVSTYYSKIVERKSIINSNGVELEDENKKEIFYTSIVASDGDKIVSYDSKIYNPNKEQIENIIKNVSLVVSNKLEEGTISSGKYKVLIDSKTMSDIFTCFIAMFNADNVYYKQSYLTDKLNKKIMSDKITLIEDPVNEDMVGKCLFDSEGTLTKKKVLVDKGILKTYLHSIKSANRDGVEPTGNMYGNISTRNLYIVPGNKSEEELLEKMGNGIMINKVVGTHVGINIITGIISLQAEGMIIKNGKRDKAIKNFVIATDFDTLFNNIIDIGNNLEFYNISFASPSILFGNISISK